MSACRGSGESPRRCCCRRNSRRRKATWPQARKLVETALQNAPDDVEALIVKAQIEATAGRRDEANKLYEHAIAGASALARRPRFALVSLAVLTGQARRREGAGREDEGVRRPTTFGRCIPTRSFPMSPAIRSMRTRSLERSCRGKAGSPAQRIPVRARRLPARVQRSSRSVVAQGAGARPRRANAGRILALVYLRRAAPPTRSKC